MTGGSPLLRLIPWVFLFACQRQLPVVDDLPRDTTPSATGRNDPAGMRQPGAAGSPAMTATGGTNRPVTMEPAALPPCMDKGPAEFIRPDRTDATANQVVVVGNELFIIEQPKPPNRPRIVKTALDGSQEVLFKESAPDSGIVSYSDLIVFGDSLFYIGTDRAGDKNLYTFPLAGAESSTRLYAVPFGDPFFGLLGADDHYVYVSGNGNVIGMRIARADGTPTYFNFEDGSHRRLYDGLLWYVVDSKADERPSGLYNLDPGAPMPTETRVGGSPCALDSEWVMSDTHFYCAQQTGLVAVDRDGSNKTTVFTPGMQESGLGTFLEFGPQDDQYVYLSVPILRE